MNKEQFKNLDILAQIEYVNNILKEGKTLTAFSEEVEISRKTISKNFGKAGYKYSQSKKQYILENTDVQAGEQKKYYSNITESNIKITPKKSIRERAAMQAREDVVVPEKQDTVDEENIADSEESN